MELLKARGSRDVVNGPLLGVGNTKVGMKMPCLAFKGRPSSTHRLIISCDSLHCVELFLACAFGRKQDP